jgi:hypothetical protein
MRDVYLKLDSDSVEIYLHRKKLQRFYEYINVAVLLCGSLPLTVSQFFD